MNETFAIEIQAATGRWQTTCQITDRPGAQVWRVTLINGIQVAVKITTGAENAGRMAAREAAVIRAAGPTAGRVLATGTVPGVVSWLVTPWWHGPTLADQIVRLRARGVDARARSSIALLAAQAAGALAALHEAGWSHGAVRAEHFIHTPHGVRLVDLGSARGPADSLPPELDFPPTGTLVGLDIAEISRRLTAGTLATPSTEADVYTFASVVWNSCTGTWPVDHHPEAGNDGEDSAPAWATAPSGWRAFKVLLKPALASQPILRPTAAALSSALSLLAALEAAKTSC
ncbi:hypothetical protein [Streptomyces hainanensis]|uniref:Protein kinase domain-containing protein n=1 Tax=Streptomyces hainanensis TaxID=402648 RepID=A0A4R4TI71_9ACTN|nr:hypothetical protein [Streptomyces hainanensis]TDC77498.1 hypothetical protein E1283_07105 [Streptomyces hainanensis]